MIVLQAVDQTLTYYLQELADGDVDAAEAKRRILESFDRQGLMVVQVEGLPPMTAEQADALRRRLMRAIRETVSAFVMDPEPALSPIQWLTRSEALKRWPMPTEDESK